MQYDDKIVEYERFCSSCVHREVPPYDDPCDDCLAQPVNKNSRRPVNYKEGNAKRVKRTKRDKFSRKKHTL